MTVERPPQPTGFFARLTKWMQPKATPEPEPAPDLIQEELTAAHRDIDRLRDELDDMAIDIESKDRQLRASAEALAKANAESARQRRLTNSLQQTLDNERRLFKQQAGELAEARKNRKRR